MGQLIAQDMSGPRPVEAVPPAPPGGKMSLMPRALVEAAASKGVELAGGVEEAAGLLVAGTLTPGVRYRYGWELGGVARWCGEHGLMLMGLSPLDVAALVVARRRSGQDPKTMLSALAFVYRHKPGGPVEIAGLARRVDKAWKAQNRGARTPVRRAAVLPLLCWQMMHAAVGSEGYLKNSNGLDAERIARDRLAISLSVCAGLRPGELGRLSASRGRIDETGRLVIPLVSGPGGGTTKTGRSQIVVPLGVAPFDVFPLADDFESLRGLRLARPGGDDHLVGAAWQYGIRGGLGAEMVANIWRSAARHAGIAGAEHLGGYSARRSMVHIGAAAGWTLEQIAAVTGHATTRELEIAYLEGYRGIWARSSEGRRLLLEGAEGWEDCPANADAGHAGAGGYRKRSWWKGRDLAADRAEAEVLARSTQRTDTQAPTRIARIGLKWEAFCEQAGENPAKPSGTLLELFALHIAENSTAYRHSSIRYLADYFAAMPETGLDDIDDIAVQVNKAAAVAKGIIEANRKKARRLPKPRKIVPVTEEAMEAMFAQPLGNREEGVRLIGLVLEQGSGTEMMPEKLRTEFRFGEHARLGGDTAELFAPAPSGAFLRSTDFAPAVTVARRGGDPLWCGYEAVRKLIDQYPNLSLRTRYCMGDLASHCTSLIRWLQARAAVAVLYATGLRPTDLGGFRWNDLRAADDGSIMWKLPYSKGNLTGDRVQVLRLSPIEQAWCPVRALQTLASSVEQAREAGWEEQPAMSDGDGAARSVFGSRVGRGAHRYLMGPAGLAVRAQDFRYRKASEVWEATGDIQQVRAVLFHKSEVVSMGYVARGLPAAARAELDPLARLYHTGGGQ